MSERILVVDDDEGLLEVCEVGLKQAGYAVTTANSGDAAVEVLDKAVFDLVLADLNMPGNIDGTALVWETRKRHRSTEVIIITGVPSLHSAIATMKNGAFDYIIKPFDIEHLKVVVRRCFDHRRLQRDLASEQAIRRELEAAYIELQKVERLKESILARVSHEFKTPLSSIAMAISMLDELGGQRSIWRGADEKAKRMIDVAGAGVRKLERTVSDLVAFAEMGKQFILEEKVPVNLEEVCRGVVDRLEPFWKPHHLDVKVRFEPGVKRVPGSSELLGRAFEHLVHNAIVFNREAGHVHVEGRMDRGRVEVAIKDTGQGIPESEFDKIFDSFYQIANYMTREVDGLGLGLAITRRILESHGGEVTVTSRKGEGTTFLVRLPGVN